MGVILQVVRQIVAIDEEHKGPEDGSLWDARGDGEPVGEGTLESDSLVFISTGNAITLEFQQ